MADPIEIFTQSDRDILATLTQDDGTPFDLTDSTIIFTVKKSLKDPDSEALIQKRVTTHVDENGDLSADQGITTIPLDHTETDICPGVYSYGVKLVDSAGNGYPTDNGTATFTQAATRDFS